MSIQKLQKKPATLSQNQWVRIIIRLLSVLSPGLTARLATLLWHRTVRFPESRIEKTVLDKMTWQLVRCNDKKIQVYLWGSGEPVLLIHGWNGRAGQLGAIARMLVDNGYQVVCFDLPGHGRSSGNSTHALESSQVILTLDQTYGPFTASISHSFGGMCMMLALNSGLLVNRAVCIAAPLDIDSLNNDFARNLQLNPATIAAQRQLIERSFGSDIWERLSMPHLTRELNLPGLLIYDSKDRYVNSNIMHKINQVWANSEILETSGLGHHRILHSKKVIEHIINFIQRI